MAREPHQLIVIGQRLADAREALTLSQAEVCRAIGIETTTWNNWEKGVRKPDPIALVRFANAYGITLDWIYRGDMNNLPHNIVQRLLKAKAANA